MTTSWVVREKATGRVLFETFSAKLVAAINVARYEAVPIGQYLAALNKPPAAPSESPVAPSEI
jgi:hypothetical protein